MIQQRITDAKEYHFQDSSIEKSFLCLGVTVNIRNTLYNKRS